MGLNDTEKEQLLRGFYHDSLMPLADSARAKGIEFFPLGPDASAESYYLVREDAGNYVHEIDATDLTKELRELWAKGDFPELAQLAEPIVQLAETIKESEETPEDVSPFIYAMF
jgi:hypothetical protein